MPGPLHMLLVGGIQADLELFSEGSRLGGYAPVVVEAVTTVEGANAALDQRTWDIIAADFSFVQRDEWADFWAPHQRRATVALLLLADSPDSALPQTALRMGACDYVFRDDPVRLNFTLQRVLRDQVLRRQTENALVEVKHALLQAHDELEMRVRERTAELRASEERYRRLVELSPDGVVVHSEGRIVFANSACARLMGADSPEELIGRAVADSVHPDHQAAVQARIRHMIQTGEPVPVAVEKFIRLDGSTFDVEVSASPVIYQDKPSVLVIVHDITGRKRSEAAILQRQRELESLLETSRDLSGLLDLKELLSLIARRALTLLMAEECTIFRVDESGTLLQPILDVGLYHEEMLAFSLKVGQGITGYAVAQNQPIIANHAQTHPQGMHVVGTPVEDEHLMVAPLVSRSRPIGAMLVSRREFKQPFSEHDLNLFVGFARHAAIAMQNAWLYQALESYSQSLEQAVEARTQELRKTKESVEAILNSSPDSILMLDTAGAIEKINSSFTTMFGYQLDEVFNQSPIILAEPSRSEAFRALLRSALEGKAARIEIIAQRRNGSTFDADVALAPLKENEQVIGLVCSIRDISALKEAQRVKDAFVSNVSHELRTPITSIRLYHDLLSQNPAKQEVYMDRLKRETTRLAAIIEDLLNLSRLEQGRLIWMPAETDLNELANQYVTDRLLMAAQRNLSLALRERPDLPTVQADDGLIGQALAILLTNALDYTPPGGEIQVTTQLHEAAGRRWSGFTVSDTGPGITPEEQPRIFERFFRGRAGRDSGKPGTGLGLSLLQEIVRRHDGWVEVTSEGIPGKGTTFTVWLPTWQ